ncbi:MAG TPA: porin family protein [Bacteroidia bacterium]|nr:porin family protein [Bacteroidia bacterium]
MKNYFLLSAILKSFSLILISIFIKSLSANLSAQVVSGAMKPKISNWENKQDRFILDINFDNWDKTPQYVEVKGFRSRGVNIMFMDEKPFGKGNVAFAWGLGFSSQNFHTNGEYKESGTIDSSYFDHNRLDSLDYDLNKLSLNYIDLPLELRFRTNANAKGNRLKLSAGFKIGVLINAHTKFDAGSIKYKQYHLRNIPDWHYGLTARLGFGKIGVSYFHSLTKLFHPGEGMEITPYSIGVSITP